MDITRTSGKRISAGQGELVTAGGNQTIFRKSWKTLAAVVLGLVLSVPELAQAQYVFTTIDVPGATSTSANGNSTHEIAGEFDDADGNTHGFVLNKGVFTTIDFPPSAPPAPRVTGTILNGINASGQITGTYFVFVGDPPDPNTIPNHAFVGDGVKGPFTTLDPKDSTRSQGGFINAQGQAVGAFRDGMANEKRRGFIWRKGTFTIFNVPGDSTPPEGFGTVPQGINDIGQVVGNYTDKKDPDNIHGFLRSSKGEFTIIDFPFGTNTTVTVANGINNAGTIVGVYVDDTGLHGFVRSSKGDFTTVDFKDENGDAHPTQINSINAKGEIVGFYVGANGVQHGFLGTPTR
jgi:hypothetical protein